MYDGPTDEFLVRETGIMVQVPELWGHFFIGRTKEGFSLNKVMVGYAGWTMERTMMNDAIPILADGIKWLGWLPKQRILWNLGAYGDFFSEGQGFSTYDNQYVARVGWLPIMSEEKRTLLHVGVSARYGKANEGKLKLRARPEAFPADYFVDTGDFACEDTKMLGFEAYYRPGPLLVGTEYFIQWANAPESGNPVSHGGEVAVTYLLTGETRAYNTRGGFFNQVSPATSVFQRRPRRLGGGVSRLLHRPRQRRAPGREVLEDHADGELAPVGPRPAGAHLRLRQAGSLQPERRHALLPEPHPAAALGAIHEHASLPPAPPGAGRSSSSSRLAGGAHAAPPTGKPLMIVLPPEALATAVGANGFVVAGTFFNGGGFHWMPTGGVVAIGGLERRRRQPGREGDRRQRARCQSAQAGRDLDRRHELAAAGLGRARPRPCDLLISSSFGTNDDGRVVVGLAWDGCSYARAFRWEESTGMVDLGSLGGESTRANGVSGDGRVVIGWEQHATGFRQAAKWVDRREELIRPGALLGEAHATNRDGSIIVGGGCTSRGRRPAHGVDVDPGGGREVFPGHAAIVGAGRAVQRVDAGPQRRRPRDRRRPVLRPRRGVGGVVRRRALPPARLPARQRRARRLRGLGQHRLHPGRVAPTGARWSATGPGPARSRASWSCCRSWASDEAAAHAAPGARRAAPPSRRASSWSCAAATRRPAASRPAP